MHMCLRNVVLIDWVVIIVLVLCTVFVSMSAFPVDFVAYISSDISNPVKVESVPGYFLYLWVYLIGTLITGVIWVVIKSKVHLAKVISAYLFSIACAHLVTAALQRFVGRPRPDSIAFCGGSGTFSQCRRARSISEANYQFRSFPSEHASLSMSAGIFLTILLSEIWPCDSMLAALINMCPILQALVICGARICDRANHVDDVVAGIFIGSVISIISVKNFIGGLKAEEKKLDSALNTESMATNGYI